MLLASSSLHLSNLIVGASEASVVIAVTRSISFCCVLYRDGSPDHASHDCANVGGVGECEVVFETFE